MWRIIPRTKFFRAPVPPCLLKRPFRGLATKAVALAHGEKSVWPNTVDELVQFSRQAVNHALERDKRLVYKPDDIVVILALVL